MSIPNLAVRESPVNKLSWDQVNRIARILGRKGRMSSVFQQRGWQDNLAENMVAQGVFNARELTSRIVAMFRRLGQELGVANLVSELTQNYNIDLYNKLEEILANPALAGFLGDELDRATLDAAATAAGHIQAMAAQMARPSTFERAFTFTGTVPGASLWAKQRGSGLVAYIGHQTRESVRQIVDDAVTLGFTPDQTAARIRRHVGLLPQQTQALDRYFRGQLNSGVPLRTADRRAGAYALRMLRQRSQTIARTEILGAQNKGQQLLWEQKVDDGQIPRNVQKIWIITRDDRTCPRCQQMTGDRAIAPLYGAWLCPAPKRNGGSVLVETPPMHPNCRCSHGLWIPEFLTAEEQTAILTGSDAGLKIKAVSKYNKNHDRVGRFARAPGAAASSVPSGDWSSNDHAWAKHTFEVRNEVFYTKIQGSEELDPEDEDFGGLLPQNMLGRQHRPPAAQHYVKGTIHDAKTAAVIGEFERTIIGSEAEAHHDYLWVDPKRRAQGIAEAFNNHVEEAYKAAGITHISLLANIDVGGYAWAKAGYEWGEEPATELAGVLRRIRQVWDNNKNTEDLAKFEVMTPYGGSRRSSRYYGNPLLAVVDERHGELFNDQVAQHIDHLLAEAEHSDGLTAWDVSRLGYDQGAIARGADGQRYWLGKLLLLGSQWQGTKWLDPHSQELRERQRVLVKSARKPLLRARLRARGAVDYNHPVVDWEDKGDGPVQFG